MSDAQLMDLTKRYLKMADGENPAVIIGSCFNVITHVCSQVPETMSGTVDFMRRVADMMEEGKNVVVEH